MALPTRFKAARMTNLTVGEYIDDHVGDLEQAICDALGFTIDSDITESPLSCDNAGRITKQLLRLAAAAPCGIRFRDTTNGKEFRLALNNDSILIDENTGTESSPTWTNRLTIRLSDGALVGDQSLVANLLKVINSGNNMQALLQAYATWAGVRLEEVASGDFVRLRLKDTGEFFLDTPTGNIFQGNLTDKVVNFVHIPVLPASDPTSDNQAARKAYVDSQISSLKKKIVIPHTWAIQGEIKVPSGDDNYIPPFFVPVPPGQTAKLIKARHRINSGTSVTVKLTKNGEDISGWTDISVTTTSTTTDAADVTFSDGDALAPVVTAADGSPENMTFTVWLEYEV